VGSFYLSLGTLTTAGTASLVAISQLASEFVSAKMVTDLLFLARAVAVSVNRLTEHDQ
jgi:hypothetical protein